MGRRTIEDRNIRKVQKTKGSHYVVIPAEMIGKLGWREKQKVVVRKIHGGVSIKDWRAR